MNKHGLKPAPKAVSQATIDLLEDLLEDAKSGEFIGMAFIGIRRGRRHFGGWVGYANQDPVFTLGAIQCLSQELIRSRHDCSNRDDK